jgi:hypothetical protein
MRRTIVACVVTALVVGGGTATAQRLITSGNIKDGTIKTVDIKNGTIKNDDIKKSTITRGDLEKRVRRLLDEGGSGPAGPQGPKGDKGDKGDRGDPGPRLSSGNWGVQNRNTIGSPGAFLRSGPFNPPNGNGSLNLVVAGGAPATPIGQLEKAAYGNEIDFTGNLVQNLNAVGFRVFTTGENITGGGGTPNMPSITIEVDPNRETSTSGFSSLVFNPPNSAANQWSPYIDATTTGLWGGTGAAFAGQPCDQNGARCSFADLKAFLNDGGEPATIFTVGITKGRDFSWQGAVDGLRINNTVYDFEETGVFERAP